MNYTSHQKISYVAGKDCQTRNNCDSFQITECLESLLQRSGKTQGLEPHSCIICTHTLYTVNSRKLHKETK